MSIGRFLVFDQQRNHLERSDLERGGVPIKCNLAAFCWLFQNRNPRHGGRSSGEGELRVSTGTVWLVDAQHHAVAVVRSLERTQPKLVSGACDECLAVGGR